RASPEDPSLVRRLAEREDGAIDLGAAVVGGDGPTGGAEPIGIVAREVRADDLPAGALVARAVDVAGADVEHVGGVRRAFDRERPLETMLERLRTDAAAMHLRPDGDVALLPRRRVPSDQPAVPGARADAAAEDGVGRLATNGDVSALAAARLGVIFPADGAL